MEGWHRRVPQASPGRLSGPGITDSASAADAGSARGLKPVPLVRLAADGQLVAALSVRFEHRRCAFRHVGPVLAEGLQNVWLVGDEHEILVGGALAGELAHRAGAARVL